MHEAGFRKPAMLWLALILLLAAGLRFNGLNWDQNQHLHPDERFLTMVAGAVRWPAGITEYMDEARSPLNPRNAGFGFYVYGVLPVALVKALAEAAGVADYDGIARWRGERPARRRTWARCCWSTCWELRSTARAAWR
jgi:hypothetical protein